ncbi:nucleoside diphosphate kinase 2, chloroplastic [Tanacetum coccineum]
MSCRCRSWQHSAFLPNSTKPDLLTLSHDDVPRLLRDIATLKNAKLGGLVLEDLRESNRVTGRKISGLPEAHTSILDDSKHGLPKKGQMSLLKHTYGNYRYVAWVGMGVVASAHKLIGETSPLQAKPGTIKEDLAVQTGRNVVHGTDSPKDRAIGNYSQILIVNNQHLSGAICKYEIASKVITTLMMRAVKACEVERRASKVKTTISENKTEISRVTMH